MDEQDEKVTEALKQDRDEKQANRGGEKKKKSEDDGDD